MSDVPQGQGWWQASDDKWYAPELHPDHRPEPPAAEIGPESTPGIDDFEPPRPDQRVGGPVVDPPQAPQQFPGGQRYPASSQEQHPTGRPDPAGQQYPPGQQHPPGQQYPVPGYEGKKRRSRGRTLAIVFGIVFLLLAGGCGVFLYAFREQIADAAIDFSEGVAAADPASCEVVGLAFSTNYDITATIDATDATVESHFQLEIAVLSSDGDVLGSEKAVFRSVAPGERRTEGVFPTITASDPFGTTTCQVVEVLRVAA